MDLLQSKAREIHLDGFRWSPRSLQWTSIGARDSLIVFITFCGDEDEIITVSLGSMWTEMWTGGIELLFIKHVSDLRYFHSWW